MSAAGPRYGGLGVVGLGDAGSIRRLGRLIEAVESECATDAGECHGHDLTDSGRCALASDLNEIHDELWRLI